MHIVLLEPEIPANTGNIGRTCVCSNTALHLIRPLGFSIDEKAVKRAGLDYWSELEITVHDSFGDFSKAFGITPDSDAPRLFMATTKALNVYSDVSYKENDFIMFGK
jgi:tRNA (cytidine/uridine-2'-O-)-methyltransferase